MTITERRNVTNDVPLSLLGENQHMVSPYQDANKTITRKEKYKNN